MFESVGPDGALRVFGVTLIGATPENGRRLLLTLAFILGALVLGAVLRWVVSFLVKRVHNRHAAFWSRQIVNIATAGLLILGVVSIWFDDPTRLTTALGLVTAGLAFALQRVITAVAGYFIILRGNTFSLGDRIVMGGVRGDVVALSFMQTTILEMGENPSSGAAGRGSWVHSRQYTGRVVTVTNAKVFDEPVYNFTRDFAYIWEEMSVPIRYGSDRVRAERILIEAAAEHTADIMRLGAEDAAELQRRYDLPNTDVRPHTYLRLTSNWIELTVRFLARTRGVRELKDAISRDVLDAFEAAGIAVASEAVSIVEAPPLRIEGQGKAPA